MSASGPSLVENPTPSDNSPVDCSSTSTVTTVLSGAEPWLLVTSTFLKKPRFLMRSLERCSLLVLNASPSTRRNLAADHLVERAHVADDVDALDIDLRPFLDVEGDVDGMVFAIAL